MGVAATSVALVSAVCVVAPRAVGATPAAWSQQTELSAQPPVAHEQFGTSVALSQAATTMVVGAPGASDSTGAAYGLASDGTNWMAPVALTPSDPVEGDRFGSEVALSGDGTVAVVSAPRKTVGGKKKAGAVYVFTRAGDAWTQQAELSASSPGAGNEFGASVSIAAVGTEVAIGAPLRTVSGLPHAGAAYVFKRTGKVWSQAGIVTAPTPAADEHFGTSVVVKETLVLVAAPQEAGGGVVDVFDGAGGSYVLFTTLTAPDRQPGDDFGAAMALTLATLVVGAPMHATMTGGEGAVYTFTHNDSSGVWTGRAEVIEPSGAPDEFGAAVAIGNDTLAVGAPAHDEGKGFSFGAIFVFAAHGRGWTPNGLIDLGRGGGPRHNGFGSSVAASGATVVAGRSGWPVDGAPAAGVVDVFANS